MPACETLFRKYPNPVFIETGSCWGTGIQQALDAGFSEIYSIELSSDLYDHCVKRFEGNKYVNLIHGDSHLVLGELLNRIDKPITFWLDGHYSGSVTVMGKYESPLIQELEIISNHFIKNHVIIIDDLRCWSLAVQGFDTELIKLKCLEINPQYRFIFEDGERPNDILVAKL